MSGLTAKWMESLRPAHSPDAREIFAQLPAIADGLQQRLRALERAPDAARLDDLIRDTAGLPVLLMRLKAALKDQAAGGSPSA